MLAAPFSSGTGPVLENHPLAVAVAAMARKRLADLRAGLPGRLLRSSWLRPLNDRAAIDDLLSLVNPLWSLREIRAVVVAARRETARARTLVLRPNGWWPGHRAGQHVAVTVEVRGRRRTRVFSVSSPPRADGLIEITVQRRDGGLVSAWWNDVAGPGDVVTLSPPGGSFVLPDPLPPVVVMLAAGSGVTPLAAMVRELHARARSGKAPTRVVFVHAAPSRADAILAERLDAIGADAAWLDRRVHCSDEGRRLRAEDFEGLARETRGAPAFVCGPAGFVAAVQRAWALAGGADLVHVESFGEGHGAAVAREHGTDDGTDSAAVLHDVGGAAGGAVLPDVTAVRSGVTFHAAPGRSLLEAAEDAGLRPAHGCRAGICHTCRCRKLSGAVLDRRDGRVLDEDGESIRLCVTTPLTAVALEL